MAAIAGESEELQQPATVGVDIDTVRSQLDDYKVCVCVLGQRRSDRVKRS